MDISDKISIFLFCNFSYEIFKYKNIFSIIEVYERQDRNEMSIGSINTFSNNSNLHQLELICNKISFSDPFQINKSLPEEVSSAEEGEIFDDVSITSEKVSDCISYTNERLNDSEISVIQDTLNTMWNSSGASSREQDKVGQPTAEILTSDEFDKIGDENVVTPQHRNNTKDKVFISNDTDIFKSQIRSNNDQDQNEPAASCHISKLVNDMCPVFHRDIVYSKPIYLFMEKNQTLTAKTFEFWPASWHHHFDCRGHRCG